ncbi:MAG: NAD(P)H-hydrate dehydratase [Clostridia bacterium]|nr:NAD(P)H-hydrate dehydratase [Clostridia bacterium]
MKRILSTAEMYACDHAAIRSGTPSRALMTRAARACVDAILQSNFPNRSSYADIRILVLCGPGNNGGDGIAAAMLLRDRGIQTDILLACDPDRQMSAECRFRYELALSENVNFVDIRAMQSTVYHTVIDAIFGIGMNKPVQDPYREIIEAANLYCDTHRVPMISIDIPSGINGDSGTCMGCAIRASKTLAISHVKRGHLLYPGAAHSGDISVLNIGISDAPLKNEPCQPTYLITDEDLRSLPARPNHSNKGTYKRILIIAGSKNMCGAAYLSAKAAYRMGAGLVEILTAEENRIPLQTLLPEAVLSTYTRNADQTDGNKTLWKDAIQRADAIVIGPGLGVDNNIQDLVCHALSCIAGSEKPAVVDADALNIIAGAELLPLPKHPWILTPHPGEFSRLMKCPISEISQNLFENALRFAKEQNVVLCAKDTHSVITDGNKSFINISGHSVMAKGGSGDVLTGIIAVLAAQGMSPLDAAAFGAYLHGMAGREAARRFGARSALASEICDCLHTILP